MRAPPHCGRVPLAPARGRRRIVAVPRAVAPPLSACAGRGPRRHSYLVLAALSPPAPLLSTRDAARARRALHQPWPASTPLSKGVSPPSQPILTPFFHCGPPSYPPSSSLSSDGVGLVSVKKAVALVGGLAWLTADDMHTTFHLKLPAKPAPDDGCEDHARTGVDQPPAAAAASTAARTAFAPPAVSAASSAVAPSPVGAPSPPTDPAPVSAAAAPMQGATRGDWGATPLAESSPPPPVSGRPVCIGIDDSLMLRKTQVGANSQKERVGWRGVGCSSEHQATPPSSRRQPHLLAAEDAC